MKKSVTIIGHFDGDEHLNDGQTVKTVALYNELKRATDWDIRIVDTYYKKKHPFRLLAKSLFELARTRRIIILLSGNGMRFYAPLLYYASMIRGTKVYHDVIGGIFSALPEKDVRYFKYLNSFKIHFVETRMLQEEMLRKGIRNAEILPLCSAIITIYFLYMKRISIRTFLLIAVGGVIVIFLVYGLRAMRHYGTLQELVENFTFSAFRSSINSSLINNKGELGLRRWFYYFISEDNEFDGFGKCATYIRMLLVFLPTRWSFGLKPDDFALTMGAAIGMAPGGSMHPTLFGDCYANLGMLGVSLGVFWAILASLADKLIFSRKNYVSMILLYVLWGAELCIIGRGAVYNGFVYIAYGSVFILFTDFIVLKTRIPQISVVISAKKR